MKIENMKLFTEYERQFKRKFPGLKHFLIPGNNGIMTFHFECLINGTVYGFQLTATNPPKNGDIEVELFYPARCMKLKFDESRKPMEMNIDNAINAAIYIIEVGVPENG
jgi:hypothetical protein